MTRVLFIAKQRKVGPYSYCGIGLIYSVRFVSEILNKTFKDVQFDYVTVIDNNDIDREVTKYKPDIVIIDALWVVPEKFDVLKKLHPKVKWIVRIHSELPFLAQEGIAIDWIAKYLEKGVSFAVNSLEAYKQFSTLCRTLYLPNLYPLNPLPFKDFDGQKLLKVGCFGAIRPLKNQLLQAVAAIHYADQHNHGLEFHINADRVERGEEILRNLRSLFNSTGYKLVEHCWHPHEEFLNIMRSMDVAMCASLSETFCIVAADAVQQGIPLVGSTAIPWMGAISKADPTKIESVYEVLSGVLGCKGFKSFKQNKKALDKYTEQGIFQWKHSLHL